jgi:probable phosphoglycerate mutase
VETAEIVGGPPTQDERLRELNFGRLEGRGWSGLSPETQRALMAFDGFQAPGGESVEQLRVRVGRFMEELPPGDHLVVTHGGVARLLLREVGMDRAIAPGSVSEVTTGG